MPEKCFYQLEWRSNNVGPSQNQVRFKLQLFFCDRSFKQWKTNEHDFFISLFVLFIPCSEALEWFLEVVCLHPLAEFLSFCYSCLWIYACCRQNQEKKKKKSMKMWSFWTQFIWCMQYLKGRNFFSFHRLSKGSILRIIFH